MFTEKPQAVLHSQLAGYFFVAISGAAGWFVHYLVDALMPERFVDADVAAGLALIVVLLGGWVLCLRLRPKPKRRSSRYGWRCLSLHRSLRHLRSPSANSPRPDFGRIPRTVSTTARSATSPRFTGPSRDGTALNATIFTTTRYSRRSKKRKRSGGAATRMPWSSRSTAAAPHRFSVECVGQLYNSASRRR